MLFYRRFLGKRKPSFIFLHGLFASSRNLLGLAKYFSSYTLYFVDLRNHGLSPHIEPHKIEDMVEDLKELIDSLPEETFFLVGHSQGGLVAMAFSCKYPEKVISFSSLDIAPRGYSRDYSGIIQALKEDLTRCKSRKEVDAIWQKYIPDKRIRDFLQTSLEKIPEDGYKVLLNVSSLEEFAKGFSFSLPRENCFLKPVLFLKGENSDFIQEKDVPLIKKYFPNAEISTILGASHWLHVEKPQEVASRILSFLSQFNLG